MSTWFMNNIILRSECRGDSYMGNDRYNKIQTLEALFENFIVILFFFVLELRWQIELLYGHVINPYYLISGLSIVFIIYKILLSILHKKYFNVVFIVVLFSILYCFCIYVINIRELITIDKYYAHTYLGVWCINLALFIIATDYCFFYRIKNSKLFVYLYIILLLSPIILMLYLGHYMEAGFSLNNQVEMMGLWNESNHGIVYQSYGDKIVLLTLFFINIYPKYKKIIICITLISLYIVGSKASFVAFVATLIVYYLVKSYNNKQFGRMLSVISLILGTGILFKLLPKFIEYSSSMANSWLFNLLYLRNRDISFMTRESIFMENMKTFWDRFFLCDYLFDVKLGRPGTYTHNALAFIDYYGIVIFLFYILVWMSIIFSLTCEIRKNNFVINTTFYSMVFMSVLFIGARNGMDYLTYWVLGMAVLSIQYKYKIKKI